MYKPTFALTEEDKRVLADINGKITIGCMERRSTFEMAQKLKLQPYELEHNIDEMLYDLLKHVGIKKVFENITSQITRKRACQNDKSSSFIFYSNPWYITFGMM